jgi:hypothetical protein
MGSGQEEAKIVLPVLWKNIFTILFVWGLGFTVGSLAMSRSMIDDLIEIEAQGIEDFDLEAWK